MKILVVGSGGREHALCWSFAQSPLCDKLYCAPGNAGIAAVAECVPVNAEDVEDQVALCQKLGIDFAMIGPEVPLSMGLADKIRAIGIPCFGPSQQAAQLESSKSFMKDMVSKAGVPTAAYKRFTDVDAAKACIREGRLPIVIKADGLAAGKGVTIAQTIQEADEAIEASLIHHVFGKSSEEIVIEEYMVGEEVSFFAICDGTNAIPFADAQDHKAVYDGDKGPNTGGMGAYSPTKIFTREMQDRVMDEIVMPTMLAMKQNGTPFTGVLFAGLMITATGPRLIEYNCRFGDPETQVMIPRLKSDLVAALYAASKGDLSAINLEWRKEAALCVVMASNGYPGEYEKNTPITGLDKAAKIPNSIVFHAGTTRDASGTIVSNGGRVLGVTAWAPTIAEAQKQAYQAVDQIDWPKGFCRRDIGWRCGVTA